MIRYTLVCAHEHDFEVWFRDSATCDAQLAAAEVPCPFCDSTQVSKALMAPNVVSGRGKDARRAETLSLMGRALAAAAASGGFSPSASGGFSPSASGGFSPSGAEAPAAEGAARDPSGASVDPGVVSGPPSGPVGAPAAPGMPPLARFVAELRAHVETTCEDVGERFAEEARMIHYGEADERPIHGSATLEDAKALHDEGIAVAVLPWTRRVEN